MARTMLATMLGICFRLLCLTGAGRWGGRGKAEGRSDIEEMCAFSHGEFKFEGGRTLQRGGMPWELQRGQGWKQMWSDKY